MIKKFIKQGGALYASDWSDNRVKALNPEAITFHTSGQACKIRAQVLDYDLMEFLEVSELELNFDLSAWVPGKTLETCRFSGFLLNRHFTE